MDIYNLEKEAVNFPAAETIVTDFGKYRDNVGKELFQHFKYEDVNLPGELKNIGSCWDGSKVGKVNEVDSLYDMKDGPFIIKKTKRAGFYKVFIKTGSRELKVMPRKLREEFADTYSQLISQMDLPNSLRHGGYNSARRLRLRQGYAAYSGVRYNGPASTSQFLTGEESLLTWDVTPCIELTDRKIQDEIRKIIRPFIAQNPRKQFPQIPVHLIPDPMENIWRVSTAQFEAELLRCLSDEAPVKKALMLCKIICSLLKRWNQVNEEPTPSKGQGVDDVEKLISHIQRNQPQEQSIERIMRYAHIWLPSEKRAEYNEDEKSKISVNTAAVKHIIIKAGLKEEGAFAPYKNEELVLKLVKVVFQTLGSDRDFQSGHAFLLGSQISHVSVLGSNVSDKVDLAKSLSEQCRILLNGAMVEVSIFDIKTQKLKCILMAYKD